MISSKMIDREIADELFQVIRITAPWGGLSRTYLKKAVHRSAGRVQRILESDPRFNQTYRRRGDDLDFSRPIWEAVDLKARSELQRTMAEIRSFNLTDDQLVELSELRA